MSIERLIESLTEWRAVLLLQVYLIKHPQLLTGARDAPKRYVDTQFSEALALEPLDMDPLNIEMAPVCPVGPSLGTLVPGAAYAARRPRLGVLLVGPAYVTKY